MYLLTLHFNSLHRSFCSASVKTGCFGQFNKKENKNNQKKPMMAYQRFSFSCDLYNLIRDLYNLIRDLYNLIHDL